MDAVAAGRGQESSPQPTQALSVDPDRAALRTSPDRRPGPDAAAPLLRPAPSHTPPCWTPGSAPLGHRPGYSRPTTRSHLQVPAPSSRTKWGARLRAPLPHQGPTRVPTRPRLGRSPRHPGLLARQAGAESRSASHCRGPRGCVPVPGVRALRRGAPLDPRSWPPAALWTLRALSASASPDPSPGPCQVPPGSLRPPSRASPPAALLPCGELGALGPARGGSAGGAAGLQEMPED